MAPSVLTGVTTYVHDTDFTTTSNKLMFGVSVEEKNVTTFRPPTDPDAGWQAVKGGLKMVDAQLDGFWDSAPDLATFSTMGVIDHVVTISPTGVEAATAYAFQASRLKYDQFDAVGQLDPFTVGMKGSNTVGMVRGQLAKAKGTVSATGALGSAVQLGAGAAGKYLYATLHVFGTPGTTITVLVQSDNASNFPSPATVATIGPLTAAGGTWMTRVDASAITDDWFRFNVSAITGTFSVAGAIAIQ